MVKVELYARVKQLHHQQRHELRNENAPAILQEFKDWLLHHITKVGAKAGAIFYSLIATCTANGIEPYKYFCTMLHRIRECQC